MALVRTPRRLWQSNNILSTALLPLAHAYDAAQRIRAALATPPARAHTPVLCVGAAVAGGAGKTPLALAIAARLATTHPQHGVAFLTRGYGGSSRQPTRVDAQTHSAVDVGDEPLLLASAAPTWVAASRWEAAVAACAEEPRPSLLLMDDGLQHGTLHRDLSLLVVDSEYLLGNRRLLPAGPLREPFERALARTDAVVALSPVASEECERLHAPPAEAALRASLCLPSSLPLLRAALRPVVADEMRLAGRRVVAFSGTARPWRFFNMLRVLGCEVVHESPLADHAVVPSSLLSALRARASECGAALVTTAKDFVRLPAGAHAGVTVIGLEVQWLGDSGSALDGLLARLVKTPA